MKKLISQLSVFSLLLLFVFSTSAHAKKIRVGVLQYGTVHWELDVIEKYKLLEKQGIELEVIKVSSSHAANVMLHSDHVDFIVGDWFWVSRQRYEGRDYTSFPYSLAEGSLMVSPDSGIQEFSDLQGRKLGVAGTEVNKNWLIMRAYSIDKTDKDINDVSRPVFASPPLLNQFMLRGDFDAVINFWHYNAQLEAQGKIPLISVDEMLNEILDEDVSVPLLVWIFRENWATKNPDLLTSFLDASFQAKKILAESKQDWQRIKKNTNTKDEKTLQVMRKAYRVGIPKIFSEKEEQAAAKIFSILAAIAGNKLVGGSKKINAGVFYSNYKIKHDKNI